MLYLVTQADACPTSHGMSIYFTDNIIFGRHSIGTRKIYNYPDVEFSSADHTDFYQYYFVFVESRLLRQCV